MQSRNCGDSQPVWEPSTRPPRSRPVAAQNSTAPVTSIRAVRRVPWAVARRISGMAAQATTRQASWKPNTSRQPTSWVNRPHSEGPKASDRPATAPSRAKARVRRSPVKPVEMIAEPTEKTAPAPTPATSREASSSR